MNTYKNPVWWTTDNDTAWDKVKTAFKRDWDQTKHDLGGNGKTHPSWNPALESELRRDWTASGGQENDWATESQFIRKGWDYKN